MIMNRFLQKAMIVAVVVLTGTLVAFSANGQTAGTANGPLSSADKHFMSNAAEGGLAEVELGRMAAEKGSSQAVRDFGQRMVDDHSKANDQLKDVAGRLGVSLPDHVSAADEAEKAKLKAYSGEHFDRAYISLMLRDHRNDIAQFRRESRIGENREVRSFASNTLPTLEQHLRLAQEAEHKLGGPARASR